MGFASWKPTRALPQIQIAITIVSQLLFPFLNSVFSHKMDIS